MVASILEKTLESALQFGDPGLDGLTDALLSLLDKDVPENVKNCAQYFSLFSNFAQRVRNQKLSSAHYGRSKREDALVLEKGFFDALLNDVCSLSGLWSVSVAVETCCLSPDARLPVGSEQAEQPGKSGRAAEQKSIWSLQSFCEFHQQRRAAAPAETLAAPPHPHHNVEHQSTSHKSAREQIRWNLIPD